MHGTNKEARPLSLTHPWPSFPSCMYFLVPQKISTRKCGWTRRWRGNGWQISHKNLPAERPIQDPRMCRIGKICNGNHTLWKWGLLEFLKETRKMSHQILEKVKISTSTRRRNEDENDTAVNNTETHFPTETARRGSRNVSYWKMFLHTRRGCQAKQNNIYIYIYIYIWLSQAPVFWFRIAENQTFLAWQPGWLLAWLPGWLAWRIAFLGRPHAFYNFSSK